MEDIVPQALPRELLLIIFVHGFKGTDSTFSQFPQRLQHNLSETIPDVTVESIVFPAYETKGELHAAVDKFVDWLATLTVEKEIAHGTGGGAGKASVVLCGHSMGGLLAADTLIALAASRPDKAAPLWPKVIAILAFDTPYYGLHPAVFKNKVTEGISYVQKATEIAQSIKGWKPSSSAASPSQATKLAITAPAAPKAGWQKWVPAAYGVGSALLVGAAAGTAYYKREDLGSGYQWMTDHTKYVGNLWDKDKLKARVDKILEISEEINISFTTIFTLLPKKPPSHTEARTFILLPAAPDRAVSHFIPNVNKLAEDEISAHVGMFQAKLSDGYYELGLETAKIIRTAMETKRASSLDVINRSPSSDHGRASEAIVAQENETDDLVQL